MTSEESHEYFDDAEWNEAMRFLPTLNHIDFWKMYCAGGEL